MCDVFPILVSLLMFFFFATDLAVQLAYQENSPLIGPGGDPEGWHTQTLSVKGKVFASRSVDVKCTIFLANPIGVYPLCLDNRDKRSSGTGSFVIPDGVHCVPGAFTSGD